VVGGVVVTVVVRVVEIVEVDGVPVVGVVEPVDVLVWVEVEVPLVTVAVEVDEVLQVQPNNNKKTDAITHTTGISLLDFLPLFMPLNPPTPVIVKNAGEATETVTKNDLLGARRPCPLFYF
jgi:hypothetical protein